MKKLTKDIIDAYMQILEAWRLTLMFDDIKVVFYYKDGGSIVIIVKTIIGDIFPQSRVDVKYEIPIYIFDSRKENEEYIEKIITEMVRKLIGKNFDIINGRIGG
jgi:hypothetical protein